MQGGKNWILPKEMNINRFFWDSHWPEIWSKNFCPFIGPNGGSVAMDSESIAMLPRSTSLLQCVNIKWEKLRLSHSLCATLHTALKAHCSSKSLFMRKRIPVVLLQDSEIVAGVVLLDRCHPAMQKIKSKNVVILTIYLLIFCHRTTRTSRTRFTDCKIYVGVIARKEFH
jgi:hypothetical protein